MRTRCIGVPPAEEILKTCILDPDLNDEHAYSHLANMICVYNPFKNAFGTNKKRKNRTQVVVNHSKIGIETNTAYKFFGVTRDHLKDGMAGKGNLSSAIGFTVCIDGIVSVLQPAHHISAKENKLMLGNYVKLSNKTFCIGHTFMVGRLLTGMTAEDAIKESNAKDIIGRIVEKRSAYSDELRISLMPFGVRRALDESSASSPTPSEVINSSSDSNESDPFFSGSDAFSSGDEESSNFYSPSENSDSEESSNFHSPSENSDSEEEPGRAGSNGQNTFLNDAMVGPEIGFQSMPKDDKVSEPQPKLERKRINMHQTKRLPKTRKVGDGAA